ncbi:DNA binding [Abeliophyllum distichum]|uniref:DNA binding n=1 Tax=Abeliophyllum distichum TaxID=126358 RepID=A0ABD1RW08_9LAMI
MDAQIPNNSQASSASKNWTRAEDVELTKAWLYISVDSDVGTNQKNTAMWNRILQIWKDNMGIECNNSRTSNSLQCRWAKIQAAVNKFHACYECMERHPQIGTNSKDMKRGALQMYEDCNSHKSFKYEHCWEIMIKNPKWCSKGLTKTNGSNKPKFGNSKDNSPTNGMTSSNLGDNCTIDSIALEGINSDGVVRPQGRKGCKEKKRRLGDEKGVVDALNKLQ